MLRNLIVCMVLVGCVRDPLPPPSVADAGCMEACDRLSELGCVGADGDTGPDRVRGTADDSTCEQACSDVLASGIVTYNVDCIASAASCKAAEGCAQ